MSENNAAVEALLDAELDDLDDLPEFKPFPAGTYHAIMSMEVKSINDKPCISMTLKLKAVEEFADPNISEEDMPKEGAESGMLFQMDNEFGQGKFKKITSPIAEHFGVRKIREIVEACKGGVDVVVTAKIKANKDKTAEYQEIVSMVVV